MLGEFINRALMLVLGYAYPALECYKTVEKNRVEIEELRFWCKYWIIVAILTVVERICDVFISWLPMYGEVKLALFIYLWYPKSKGTGYVYEAFLQPYLTQHETDIERKLRELRIRAWDLAIFYWHNCTELGQSKLAEVIQHLTGQSTRRTDTGNERDNSGHGTAPPPPAPLEHHRQTRQSGKKRSNTVDCAISQNPKSKVVQVHVQSHDEPVTVHETGMVEKPKASWLRLRRSPPRH